MLLYLFSRSRFRKRRIQMIDDNQGQWVTYWREKPLEIDAVFQGS